MAVNAIGTCSFPLMSSSARRGTKYSVDSYQIYDIRTSRTVITLLLSRKTLKALRWLGVATGFTRRSKAYQDLLKHNVQISGEEPPSLTVTQRGFLRTDTDQVYKGKDEILLSKLILEPQHSILTQSYDSRLRLVCLSTFSIARASPFSPLSNAPLSRITGVPTTAMASA